MAPLDNLILSMRAELFTASDATIIRMHHFSNPFTRLIA